MTYTFKAHNFRIDLPTHWELRKAKTSSLKKPLFTAYSKEDRIHLEVYTTNYQKRDMQEGFILTLKNLQLWAENYTSLDQEAEFPLYHLKGYWAKTMGYKQKRKIFGYLVYATDGVNLFIIHSYTQANLFPKNFLSMKEIFKGFSLNRNYKNECCNECITLSLEGIENQKASCANFTETNECMFFFQNQPMSVLECN
ncbi:MAG TPA: hypothetical protein PLS71_23630 [Leptospiraceae bacterium]|nr:hypothetical protein [Leptospiraceae bacterium]HNC01255.1 hypothetical protein [Leptospiraceae bacterium]HNE07747.1 hypothetical protein [Leptospiraceae bacterium]HNG99855.1 hypothetical protein [Leptospiraceae bacterium]HNI89184.1 hypothetical protein [Leptospiraceae bacterium]